MLKLYKQVKIKPTGETGTIVDRNPDGSYVIDPDRTEGWTVIDVKEDDLEVIDGE